MAKYKKEKNLIILENENGSVSYIPIDPANSDYQAYLKSLDEMQAQQLGGN